MKNAAVICEFDPLHLGHEYLIRSIREQGAERVVCIMSGAICQRGEPSVFPKHQRAAAAIAAGADLVLELPFPYSSASAEFFAFGAVSVIASLGCIDTLGFGCECGDAAFLSEAADILRSESFEREYERQRDADRSIGAAAAIERAYSALTGDGSLFSGANNVLALEYIKAARALGLDLSFFAVKRQGAGHSDTTPSESGYASATMIRKALSGGELARQFMPNQCIPFFERAIERGEISEGLASARSAVLSHFRLLDQSSPETAESGGGLRNRMISSAEDADGFDSFILKLKTKKYTDARLRRAIIFSMCSVTDADLRTPPAYTTLLAASKHGIELLSEIKKSVAIPIISTPSALSTLPDGAQRARLLCRRAEALRSLTLKKPTSADAALRLPPVIF